MREPIKDRVRLKHIVEAADNISRYTCGKTYDDLLADNTRSGHGGTYEQPNGGANARMVRAWLDWQLKDKTEHSKLFIDGDLADYEGFTIKHKNFGK